MRIASFYSLVAVLSLAAILLPRPSSQNNRSATRHPGNRRELMETDEGDHYVYYGGESRRMTIKEMQLLLRHESGEKGLPVDCCPSVTEMIEPDGGKNQNGEFVLLYRKGEIRQSFFEKSCRKDVEGKPCRFVDRRLQNQSQCVQQYTFSYAIVQHQYQTESGPSAPQRHHHHQSRELSSSLDYIRLRSGCSCEVMPKGKKKRNSDHKAKKGKSKKFDDDET